MRAIFKRVAGLDVNRKTVVTTRMRVTEDDRFEFEVSSGAVAHWDTTSRAVRLVWSQLRPLGRSLSLRAAEAKQSQLHPCAGSCEDLGASCFPRLGALGTQRPRSHPEL